MPKQDEKDDGEGSVWRGLARMEAEVQDPEEGETEVYDSRRMKQAALALLAAEADAKEKALEDRPAEEPRQAATAELTAPDEGPVSGARPKQPSPAEDEDQDDSAGSARVGITARDDVAIEIIAERDGELSRPRLRPKPPEPHRRSQNGLLWALVVALTIVAAALAWLRWGRGAL